MVSVSIELEKIVDWPSFHQEFQAKMGFPDFYGANLYAWMDCMSDLSRPGLTAMTNVLVPIGEPLALELKNLETWKTQYPELFQGFLEAVGFVNRTKMTLPDTTKILLLPY